MKLSSFKYFYPEKPRLISKEQSLFSKVSQDPRWVAEYKFNGSRLQLHNLTPNHFEFWDRHGKQLVYKPDDSMKSALNEFSKPTGYNLFDGELRHNKVIGIRHKIVLYDIFIWNGELLIDKTFSERRKILESILSDNMDEQLSISRQFQNNFEKLFESAISIPEIEGLVMKKLSGMINLGRNSGINSMWMMKVRKQTGRHRF